MEIEKTPVERKLVEQVGEEVRKDRERRKGAAAARANEQIELDQQAQRFFDLLFEIDPTWRERDEACAAEWELSAAQRLLKYAAIVLDQQLHLNLLNGYDFLEPESRNGKMVAPMSAECPQCHHEFKRAFPGQVCCSNECGDKYFPAPTRKTYELPPDFQEHLKAQNERKEPKFNGDPRVAAIPVPMTAGDR